MWPMFIHTVCVVFLPWWCGHILYHTETCLPYFTAFGSSHLPWL